MEIVSIGLGLSLVLVTLVALKYKRHLEDQIDEYREANDELYDELQKRNRYVKKLEEKIVGDLGPHQLADVLNRVFRERDEDSNPLSDESSAEETGN